MLPAGIVDQDVDGAEPGLDPRHSGVDLGAFGHVEGRLEDLRPLPAQFHGGVRKGRRIAAVDGDRGSGGGQPARQRKADAAAGAGDQGAAAGQVELVMVHPGRLLASRGGVFRIGHFRVCGGREKSKSTPSSACNTELRNRLR